MEALAELVDASHLHVFNSDRMIEMGGLLLLLCSGRISRQLGTISPNNTFSSQVPRHIRHLFPASVFF